MKIVFLSHTALGSPYVVGSHQLAKAYADAGHEVLHISAPITPFHRLGTKYTFRKELASRGIHQVSENLMAWVPQTLVPWQVAKWFLTYGNLYISSVSELKSNLSKVGMLNPDVLLMDEPRMVGAETVIKANHSVYRPLTFIS